MPPAAMGMTPFGWHSFLLQSSMHSISSRRGSRSNATRKRLREAGFAEKLEDGAIEDDLRFPRTCSGSCKDLYPGRCIQPGLSARCRQRLHNIGQLPPCGLYEAAFPGWNQTGSYVSPMHSGHPAGRQEKEHLLAFAENLDERQWHCAYINLINQPAAPPEILLITREKRPE